MDAGNEVEKIYLAKDEGQKPRALENQHTPSALPIPKQVCHPDDIPAMSRTRQHPLPSLSAILGITDKGPDLSSLLPSCFRTEIYSSQPSISPTTDFRDSSQACHKTIAAGALQLLPWPVGATESSPGTGGSTIRSRSGKAAPPHKPRNCSAAPAHITHTV